MREPHPSSAFLVVEVAESSLAKDRGIKARLYAAAGVLEYWVVDLHSMRIEVRTGPNKRAYAHRRTAGLENAIRLVAFPDVEIRVGDVLR
jgi:Uma2 family endonuclease